MVWHSCMSPKSDLLYVIEFVSGSRGYYCCRHSKNDCQLLGGEVVVVGLYYGSLSILILILQAWRTGTGTRLLDDDAQRTCIFPGGLMTIFTPRQRIHEDESVGLSFKTRPAYCLSRRTVSIVFQPPEKNPKERRQEDCCRY
jgi:hypothetical protein